MPLVVGLQRLAGTESDFRDFGDLAILVDFDLSSSKEMLAERLSINGLRTPIIAVIIHVSLTLVVLVSTT